MNLILESPRLNFSLKCTLGRIGVPPPPQQKGLNEGAVRAVIVVAVDTQSTNGHQ